MTTPKLIACSALALVCSPLLAIGLAAFVCTMTFRWAVVEIAASYAVWRATKI